MAGLPGIRKVLAYRSVGSTQDEAKRLAERGAAPGTLVTAERQTRGRGRGERRWASGPGGVYFSLILRPRLRPAGLAKLSLRLGRALARALAEVSGLRTKVKPPNDILAMSAGSGVRGPGSGSALGSPRTPRPAPRKRWRKVAGILLEARGGPRGELDWLVAGVGVNVTNRLPRALPDAASLSALARRRLAPRLVLRRAVRTTLAVCDGGR